MKRTFLVAFLVVNICFLLFNVFFFAYNQKHLQPSNNTSAENSDISFYIDNNITSYEEWIEKQPASSIDGSRYVKDKETALSIASAVFYANYPSWESWEPFYLCYMPNIGVYTVSFAEPTIEEVYGGDMTVVIDEKTGAILNIFPGE